MALLKKYSPQVGFFEMCTELPPRVNSEGFFNLTAKDKSEALLSNEMPELQLNIILILLVSQVFQLIIKPFRVPELVPQIIAGMYLSFVISYTKGTFFKDQLFSRSGQEILGTLSSFGYILFLFGTSVKMDMDNIRNIGRKAIIIGISVVLAPLLCVVLLYFFLLKSNGRNTEFFFLAMTQNTSSFAVVVSLLSSLDILNTELGRVALASSVVADVIGFLHMNIIGFMAIYTSTNSLTRSCIYLLVTVFYLCVLFFIIRPLMRWIVNRTPEGRPVKDLYVYFIILWALASGIVTNWGEQRILYWPYFLGLVVPNGPPLGSAIGEKLDCFVSSLFVPLFITSIAMRVDITRFFFTSVVMKYALFVIVLCFLAKCVACVIPCLFFKMPAKDSTALAIIMASKGIVDIALYATLRDNSVISEGLFTLVMFTTLTIAFIGPIVVRRLYNPSIKYVGYQKRNIMHLKPNSELKILSCIQKLDDIPAMIDLLSISCSTKENLMCVNVLHLIELVGRASPLFISHKTQNKSVSPVSYSENVIFPFSRFEKDNSDVVQVNVFTSISPHKLMHDDICTLALDKLTSLILLPFHRKWSFNGNIEVEDNMVRALNNSVLQLAPCSVGILINRGLLHNIPKASSDDNYLHSICVIFLGGKDDREGLIYAKRMARDSNVSLTVVHVFASLTTAENQQDDPKNNWEEALDNEVLRDVKYSNIGVELNYVSYVEEVVNDGSEVASIVRSLIDDYNLIICGRRYGVECPQTSGLLTEWSEFPELGVIGDLFASTDLKGKASVLIMQQQMVDLHY